MFDLTWPGIRHGLAIAGRSLAGRWQQTAALGAVAVMMSMGGLAASSSAASSSPSAAPAAIHVNSGAPWHYIDSYFFLSTCHQVGQYKIALYPWFLDYKCINGGLFSDWELWGQYW
jgi:hypothetical protein